MNPEKENQNLKYAGYQLAQWTWGLPQTLSGLVLSLHYRNCPQENFCGAHVTYWPHKSSLSLGMFLFLTDEPFYYYQKNQRDHNMESFLQGLKVHEYGHTIQSLVWGPLYLITVGLPSVLWAMLPPLKKLRKEKRISYFSVYPENQANRLGERFTGFKSIGTPIS